ncbi:AAA family ATPase [Brevibacillus laterosporus]|uniref:AAA family ATPase n=1 Tax=Brevibacillus laterosporus TaxID=1465 RepID=UPI002E1EBC10|nr:AAA family ATPase [Brevibacillus laterosporus]
MFRVKNIHIENINGIRDLKLNFSDGINLISGPNGIGKSTILNCILASFSKTRSEIRQNVQSTSGGWGILFVKNCNIRYHDFIINDKTLYYDFQDHYVSSIKDNNRKTHIPMGKDVISFSTNNRLLDYPYNGKKHFLEMKKWIYKRYYNSGSLNMDNYNTLELIKASFSEIDSNIRFSRIIKRNVELDFFWYENTNNKQTLADELILLVETSQGEIPIEYLSSGYKSIINIILGIIRKVTMRDTPDAYSGLILIDELDLHLHPEWQSKLLNLIKWIVPNAQIIATTHSPHIIQSAEPGEIIPLGFDKHLNNTYLRELPKSDTYGYQGWNIEEILVEVMGLENPMSIPFQKHFNMFNSALKNNDKKTLTYAYDELKKMVHPNNPLIKLLSIQSGLVNIWDEEGGYND